LAKSARESHAAKSLSEASDKLRTIDGEISQAQGILTPKRVFGCRRVITSERGTVTASLIIRKPRGV